MDNFTYRNPVKIVFGKGSIAELSDLLSKDQKILMTYGGGSIKRNGVYDQVMDALKGYKIIEFGGIEPNPRYEILMSGVELARSENIDFILAVGGGSVLDGSKFIAAAIPFDDGDPWKILSASAQIKRAVPLGSVLTLPATGSEMNTFAVISRNSTREKLAFGSYQCYPVFSILDPETTMSLPEHQVANGIVDIFAHVMEQYMTYPVNAALQDRQAEAIILTLLEEAPRVQKDPTNYDTRANIVWCATQALNGLIGCGVPQDWTTHTIGHELTAFYGIDHGPSLAVVMPAVMRLRKKYKADKLLQFGERIFGIKEGDPETRINKTIDKIEEFFRSVGVGTRLKDYDIPRDGLGRISRRIFEREGKIGERANIGKKEIDEIFELCA